MVDDLFLQCFEAKSEEDKHKLGALWKEESTIFLNCPYIGKIDLTKYRISGDFPNVSARLKLIFENYDGFLVNGILRHCPCGKYQRWLERQKSLGLQ